MTEYLMLPSHPYDGQDIVYPTECLKMKLIPKFKDKKGKSPKLNQTVVNLKAIFCKTIHA